MASIAAIYGRFRLNSQNPDRTRLFWPALYKLMVAHCYFFFCLLKRAQKSITVPSGSIRSMRAGKRPWANTYLSPFPPLRLFVPAMPIFWPAFSNISLSPSAAATLLLHTNLFSPRASISLLSSDPRGANVSVSSRCQE